MQEYERHEFSYAWPEMPIGELGILVQSMRLHGFDPEQPIVLYESQILDGWNRYRAAMRANVEPAFRVFQGDAMEALDFAERRNSARRQLTKGQQATALVKLDKQRPAAVRRSVEEIAALIGKGTISTVRQAAKLVELNPDVADDVIAGKVKFGMAVREEIEANRDNVRDVDAVPTVDVKFLNTHWRCCTVTH